MYSRRCTKLFNKIEAVNCKISFRNFQDMSHFLKYIQDACEPNLKFGKVTKNLTHSFYLMETVISTFCLLFFHPT